MTLFFVYSFFLLIFVIFIILLKILIKKIKTVRFKKKILIKAFIIILMISTIISLNYGSWQIYIERMKTNLKGMTQVEVTDAFGEPPFGKWVCPFPICMIKDNSGNEIVDKTSFDITEHYGLIYPFFTVVINANDKVMEVRKNNSIQNFIKIYDYE